MFELKTLHEDAVPSAIAKAERYRLLNEPGEAESICLDILAVSPDNHDAVVTLILALTDQFEHDRPDCISRARELLPHLADEFERAYYSGIIAERQAKAVMRQVMAGATARARQWLRQAMSDFERAEAHQPHGNDDAILRWNACARIMMRLPDVEETADERVEVFLE